ncbi:hypothetical protein WA026_012325 [Henosepilachna vigintioctopunctata]|uniref:Uncharacterized protein n=1 Tax=Henosepilachna vigintioctopunctata TaxID=420089 RepID=A0AAW1UZZ4_9CUCU
MGNQVMSCIPIEKQEMMGSFCLSKISKKGTSNEYNDFSDDEGSYRGDEPYEDPSINVKSKSTQKVDKKRASVTGHEVNLMSAPTCKVMKHQKIMSVANGLNATTMMTIQEIFESMKFQRSHKPMECNSTIPRLSSTQEM